MELLDPRHRRPRAAGRRAARVRARGLGPLHQHQRKHDAPRSTSSSAIRRRSARKSRHAPGRSASTRRYVYGLIRQESRFIVDARSGVGASGLMQLHAGDGEVDRQEDRPALQPVAHHRPRHQPEAGQRLPEARPRRCSAARRRWPRRPTTPARAGRASGATGPVLDAAVWAENIPFTETRDYVKKVLSNSTYYAALLGGKEPPLRSRLGRTDRPARSQRTAAGEGPALTAAGGLGENRRSSAPMPAPTSPRD